VPPISPTYHPYQYGEHQTCVSAPHDAPIQECSPNRPEAGEQIGGSERCSTESNGSEPLAATTLDLPVLAFAQVSAWLYHFHTEVLHERRPTALNGVFPQLNGGERWRYF
jgi:hypothetical protein